MTKTNITVEAVIVAHWGLVGSNSSTNAEYRPQNPWQALEHYMEQKRGDAARFFRQNGATATKIDRGGSVWRVDLTHVPTRAGLAIDEFGRELLDKLVAQNTNPVAEDSICVTYSDGTLQGRWEWVHP